MRLLLLLATSSLLWWLVSWNRRWSNPLVDEREKGIQVEVRAFISRAVETGLVILLGYCLLGMMLPLSLPQPSAFLVLCILGGVGCAAEAVANFYFRKDDGLA